MKLSLLTPIKWLFSSDYRRQVKLYFELHYYVSQIKFKKRQLVAELNQCSDPMLRQSLEEKISILTHQEQKLREQITQN